MWSAAPSVVISVTSPRMNQYFDGRAGSATLIATRGSRSMLRAFW